MAAFGATGHGAIFLKIFVCSAILIVGTVAGWLSIERPSEEAATATRRNLTDAEKHIIVGAIRQHLEDVTLTMVTWSPLILLSRAGVTDYCGVIKDFAQTFGFYAQLVFPRNNPREKLSQVSFTIIAMPDDPEANYVVDTACLRYGYGASMSPVP